MLVYRSAAHIEIPGDCIDVQRLVSNQADDLPTGGVGYRLKYISSHKMKPFGCKIVQTGRPTKIFYTGVSLPDGVFQKADHPAED
jgi:hypothetical protein